ncbi:MAG: type VI secretion system baseplate subunit TssG [Candidatus Kapaibacterium sp.]
MASYGWGTEYPVADWLFEEGYRFDFHQAVRLLELMYPGRSPVGESGAPFAETVRFKSSVSLAFPAGEIREIRHPADNGPVEMTVNFFGIAGAMGPLPLAYTELIMQRVALKDTALRDFLDIFNHRLVSLMHRVRKLHRIGLDHLPPDQSHVAQYLFNLIGLGTKGLRNRMGIEDRSLLHYAGLIAQKPHSMAGLEMLLSDYFQAPVRGRQLIGCWVRLEADQATLIGKSGRNQILGKGAALGTRVWDQLGKFALDIGPISFTRLLDFLPHGGSACTALRELTLFYAGDEHDFDVNISVIPDTVPGTRLGDGMRLGWTTWLKSTDDPSTGFAMGLSSFGRLASGRG